MILAWQVPEARILCPFSALTKKETLEHILDTYQLGKIVSQKLVGRCLSLKDMQTGVALLYPIMPYMHVHTLTLCWRPA